MKERIAILSILANLFLAIGKIAVGVVSNSAAILAAGVDSFVDIFSSAISYIGIKLSAKPADKKHPYGHHKFEVAGSVVITIIILTTGIGIIYEAVQNFLQPQEVQLGYLAFGIMIISGVVNEVMSRLKTYYGKKENSISLLSDGVHSRIDVYTSLVILAGMLLTPYWIYTDAILAVLMGIYIMKEAVMLGKDAAGSLLDVSAGDEMEDKIENIVSKNGIDLVSLKTQKKGSAVSANLEIELSSDLKVEQATKISNDLRDKLLKAIDELQYVVIQITSHEVENNFYKPFFGGGFGWQRRGQAQVDNPLGKGPDGKCICHKCGYEIVHKKGTPCSTIKCPICKINLERK